MSSLVPKLTSLRERKKAKTRIALQQHALRLFRENGYAATTVEQIAEAAEVSPSTVFRYFPTKEDLVLQDDYDPMMVEVFRSQPADLTSVQAIRKTFKLLFSSLGTEESAYLRDRIELMNTVPELRDAVVGNAGNQGTKIILQMVAERSGLPEDDFQVQALGGAFKGLLVSVMAEWVRKPETVGLGDSIDRALSYLENGFQI